MEGRHNSAYSIHCGESLTEVAMHLQLKVAPKAPRLYSSASATQLTAWDTDIPMLFMKSMASWPFGFFCNAPIPPYLDFPQPILLKSNSPQDFLMTMATKVVFFAPPLTTNKLTAQQRTQLVRKARKIEQLLGSTPRLVDTSVRTLGTLLTNRFFTTSSSR
jgi:hypothetical protein